jgi:hypothetical protein
VDQEETVSLVTDEISGLVVGPAVAAGWHGMLYGVKGQKRFLGPHVVTGSVRNDPPTAKGVTG